MFSWETKPRIFFLLIPRTEMNRNYQSGNFNSFNRNMRRINYNNRDIHRELNEAMDSINRSILSLNSMGYDVYSDRHSLAATLRQPRSTPRHPGRSGSFNLPTIASSSNRNHNARQYVTSTERSIDTITGRNLYFLPPRGGTGLSWNYSCLL